MTKVAAHGLRCGGCREPFGSPTVDVPLQGRRPGTSATPRSSCPAAASSRAAPTEPSTRTWATHGQPSATPLEATGRKACSEATIVERMTRLELATLGNVPVPVSPSPSRRPTCRSVHKVVHRVVSSPCSSGAVSHEARRSRGATCTFHERDRSPATPPDADVPRFRRRPGSPFVVAADPRTSDMHDAVRDVDHESDSAWRARADHDITSWPDQGGAAAAPRGSLPQLVLPRTASSRDRVGH